MKKLIELGNAFASQSSWKDYALTKFCLMSMGLFIGLFIPDGQIKTVAVMAVVVFVFTLAILLCKVYKVYKNMK